MHRPTSMGLVLFLACCGSLLAIARPARALTCRKQVCPEPGACQVRESEACIRGGGALRCPAILNATNGTACSDGNACTQSDTCQAGICTGSNPVVCPSPDQCHAAGTCNPATGACLNPAQPNGTSCSDGDACTQSDTCQTGVCTGSNPVVCSAPDQCHATGTCNPATGVCSNPAQPNGTSCTDGNACTQSDTCQTGTCVGTPVTPAYYQTNTPIAVYPYSVRPGFTATSTVTNCGASCVS